MGTSGPAYKFIKGAYTMGKELKTKKPLPVKEEAYIIRFLLAHFRPVLHFVESVFKLTHY